MEELQELAPEAHFVKAFNCVGNSHMVDPKFESTPTMFICRNNPVDKKEVTEILDRFGWERKIWEWLKLHVTSNRWLLYGVSLVVFLKTGGITLLNY